MYITKKIDDNLHDKFVDVVYKIVTSVGMKYSRPYIEKMVLEQGYLLCFPCEDNKVLGKWNLGIWAVGKWGLTTQEVDDEGNVIDSWGGGYGVETYKEQSIAIFLVHEWFFDKFRPTYSDYLDIIENFDEKELNTTIGTLKHVFKNPITSYYNIIDLDDYSLQHEYSNKYISYAVGYYKQVFKPKVKRLWRRVKGWTTTKFIKTLAKLDPRVAYVKYTFQPSEWNPEFEFAVVLNFLDTDYDEYKAWKLYDGLANRNVRMNITSIDEEGNFPKNIWRGYYWNTIPKKDE